MISLIAAANYDRVIAYQDMIPWKSKADLSRFRKLTWNCPVIFGRKTFESLPKLPNRTLIPVSRSHPEMYASLEEAIKLASSLSDQVWIGGGGEIYAQALELADQIDLTYVDFPILGAKESDLTFFPEIPDTFEKISEHQNPEDPRLTHCLFQKQST